MYCTGGTEIPQSHTWQSLSMCLQNLIRIHLHKWRTVALYPGFSFQILSCSFVKKICFYSKAARQIWNGSLSLSSRLGEPMPSVFLIIVKCLSGRCQVCNRDIISVATTHAVHKEYCKGWWLFSCRSSVAEHWKLNGVLGLVLANYSFLYFPRFFRWDLRMRMS